MTGEDAPAEGVASPATPDGGTDTSPGTASGDDPPAGETSKEALLENLEELERTVDSAAEREQVRSTLRLAARVPGGEYVSGRIQKYTTRDVAEAVVGGILLSLPMLVEDGVFAVAGHLASERVAGLPVYLLANVAFVVVMTIGLLYWADFRDVRINNPLFGVIPRRLVGVLAISLVTAVAMMAMWGRLWLDDPTRLEVVARVTVLWTAAAFGAALGDILPGESKGHDVTIENLDDIIKPDQ